MMHGACLLGEDLAVIPGAAEEEVAIVIRGVPGGDQAMDMQRPPEAVFQVSHPNAEDLHGTMRSRVARDGSECKAHGTKTCCMAGSKVKLCVTGTNRACCYQQTRHIHAK